jgi:GT2 family glycosyltransferase
MCTPVDIPPLVSVVVVCFKDPDLTRQCMLHIVAQKYHPIEIIVVDNGSPEKIGDMIRDEFPQARLIRTSENLGFAGGYNVGIRAATGKYVAIINNDAMAASAWIESMVAIAELDPMIGAVASVITDGTGSETIDSCGIGIALDGMSRQMLKGAAKPILTGPKEVLAPSGCACLFRATALEAVGLFDEAFFAYCEDTDLGLRLRWAGYKSVVAPNAEVKHFYSMTAGRFSLLKIYWVERNHYWVALKNFPAILLLIVPLITIARYAIQAYALISRTGDLHGFTDSAPFRDIVKAILKAHGTSLLKMVSMLRKRHYIMAHRKLNAIGMTHMIWKHRISISEIILGSDHARK